MLVMSTAVAHDNYYGRFPHQNKDGHARRQGCATDCVPPFITHVSFSSNNISEQNSKKKTFQIMDTLFLVFEPRTMAW